jgi:ATP/maltotriose-dependent transcriptional regulator MalT
LRAALRWSLGPDGDPGLGVKFASYTDWLWRELMLVHAQRRWFELALTFVDHTTPPSVEARICLGLGWGPYGDRGRLSHNLRAVDLIKQAGGEPVLLGQALTQAATSASRYKDVSEAKRYHDEALSVLRGCDRTKLTAYALMCAGGGVHTTAGDLLTARALVGEALALAKALGDVRLCDHCEVQLAAFAAAAGHMTEAIDRCRRAVETSRQHGTLTVQLLALQWLAAFLLFDDQIELGRAAAHSALELSRALGNVGLPGTLYQLALVIAVDGESHTAARLAGFADAYADERQLDHNRTTTAIRSRLIERLHSAMSPEACQTAMAAGAAWGEQEAVAAAEAAGPHPLRAGHQ